MEKSAQPVVIPKKTNRVKGRFTCNRCGYSDSADHNAALNIAQTHILLLEQEAGRSQSAKCPAHGDKLTCLSGE